MAIYFTSGTTGTPKMVEHTQASYGLGFVASGEVPGVSFSGGSKEPASRSVSWRSVGEGESGSSRS